MKFQKYLGFFLGFWIVFFEFFKILKNIGFSKIPKFRKIHQSPQVFLKFWKTQWFFGILKNSKKKTPRFFGILVENLEKPKVFFFGIYYEIPKNLGFF